MGTQAAPEAPLQVNVSSATAVRDAAGEALNHGPQGGEEPEDEEDSGVRVTNRREASTRALTTALASLEAHLFM